MKTIYVFMALILMSVLQAGAQSIVTGVYADSTSMESIPYATVAIFKGDATQPESVGLTTLNGSFELRTKSNGNYRLSITNMGNKPVNEPFVADGKKVNFGKILAVTATERLDELTVVAVKPIIKAEVDRISYDVEADPEAPAKNALEMLRKMPHITVDGEDKIQLNGNSSFKIHVNGKPSSLFDSDPGKILKSIPASAVKKIEVITSPGARYDAEGVGGIINLEMSQASNLDGYTAIVSLNAELPKRLNPSVNFMVKKGKLTASGRAFYIVNEMPILDINYKFEYAPFDGTNETLLMGPQKNKEKNGLANIDLTYEIDSMRLLNVNWNYNKGKGSYGIRNGYVTDMRDCILKNSLRFGQPSEWAWISNEFNVNYERKLNRNHVLIMSFRGYLSPNNSSQDQMDYWDIKYADTLPLNYYGYVSRSDKKSNEYMGQIDYIGSLGSHHTLEAGGKYTMRVNESASLTTYTREVEPLPTDSIETSSLENEQNILALYSSYALKLSKFSAKLGLRIENNKFDATSVHSDNVTPFSYNFTDVVPSVFLSYNVKPTQTFKISYNMRIMRPGISYLNPYHTNVSPFEVQYGNVELESENHHSLQLSYSNFAQLAMVNASLLYNFCDNTIINHRFVNNEGVLESTYGNYGERKQVRLSLYGNFTFTKSTSMFMSAALGYTRIKSVKLGEETDGFEPNIYVSLNQRLPLNVQANLYGAYQGKNVQLQGEGFDVVVHGMSLSKSLVNERLNITLSSQNFFNPHIRVRQVQSAAGARSVVTTDYPLWNVRLGVSYRIGELKASVRKVRSIESDDVVGNSIQGNSGTSVQTSE